MSTSKKDSQVHGEWYLNKLQNSFTYVKNYLKFYKKGDYARRTISENK